jgi:hypothetical protein
LRPNHQRRSAAKRQRTPNSIYLRALVIYGTTRYWAGRTAYYIEEVRARKPSAALCVSPAVSALARPVRRRGRRDTPGAAEDMILGLFVANFEL